MLSSSSLYIYPTQHGHSYCKWYTAIYIDFQSAVYGWKNSFPALYKQIPWTNWRCDNMAKILASNQNLAIPCSNQNWCTLVDMLILWIMRCRRVWQCQDLSEFGEIHWLTTIQGGQLITFIASMQRFFAICFQLRYQKDIS